MKKIKDLLCRHKILTVLCLITVVFVLILSYFSLSIFVNGNNSYGRRLDGIEEVSISKSRQNKLAKDLESKDEVEEASVRIQGKIVYINIVYTNDTSLDKAKEIANSTLESFEKDELDYYDIGYFLTQKGGEEDKNYFISTGTKHAKMDGITYIKS